jgi:lipocalin
MLLALATSVAAIHGFRSIEMIGRGPRVTCPPRGYGIIENFDARQYFNGSWYPLAQQLSIFQPERTFFCTRATYSLQESGDVKAINEARKTCVNGKKTSVELHAYLPDANVPNKVKVATCLSIYLSIYLFIYLSIYLDIYRSIVRSFYRSLYLSFYIEYSYSHLPPIHNYK